MKLIFSILLFLSTLNVFSQTIVYSNIVSDQDTISGLLTVYKQVDLRYVYRTKPFRNQCAISLDPSTYVLVYEFKDRRHVEYIVIDEYDSVIILNILDEVISINDFDFMEGIYASPGFVELIIQRKQEIYMEF